MALTASQKNGIKALCDFNGIPEEHISLSKLNFNSVVYPLKLRNSFKKLIFDLAGYHPFPVQERFHYTHCQNKIYPGGARQGKSKALAMDYLPYWFFPGTRQWHVAPFYDLGDREFQYIYESIHRVLEQKHKYPFLKHIELVDDSYNISYLNSSQEAP